MSVDGRPTWVEHPFALRIRLGRPVVDVTLPDVFVEVPTSDGDVLLPGETFESLRDSMIGVSYAVDVGPNLRDVPLDALGDLADLSYELERVAVQVARPRPSFGETTLEVERCPTCGKPDLKWHPTQSFDCADAFHETGIANPRRINWDAWTESALPRYENLGPDDPTPPAVSFDAA